MVIRLGGGDRKAGPRWHLQAERIGFPLQLVMSLGQSLGYACVELRLGGRNFVLCTESLPHRLVALYSVRRVEYCTLAYDVRRTSFLSPFLDTSTH